MDSKLNTKIIGYTYVIWHDNLIAADLYEGNVVKFPDGNINSVSEKEYKKAYDQYLREVENDNKIKTAYEINQLIELDFKVPSVTADPEAAEKEWYIRKHPQVIPVYEEPEEKKKRWWPFKKKKNRGIICSGCGTVNKEGQKFCGECGEKLPVIEDVKEDPAAPPELDVVKTENENDRGKTEVNAEETISEKAIQQEGEAVSIKENTEDLPDGDAPELGEQAMEEKVKCSMCGNLIKKEERFCSACGQRVEQKTDYEFCDIDEFIPQGSAERKIEDEIGEVSTDDQQMDPVKVNEPEKSKAENEECNHPYKESVPENEKNGRNEEKKPRRKIGAVICPLCGTANKTWQRYCGGCGEQLFSLDESSEKTDASPIILRKRKNDKQDIEYYQNVVDIEKQDDFSTNGALNSRLEPEAEGAEKDIPLKRDEEGICPICGTVSIGVNKFCSNCGAKMSAKEEVYEENPEPVNTSPDSGYNAGEKVHGIDSIPQQNAQNDVDFKYKKKKTLYPLIQTALSVLAVIFAMASFGVATSCFLYKLRTGTNIFEALHKNNAAMVEENVESDNSNTDMTDMDIVTADDGGNTEEALSETDSETDEELMGESFLDGADAKIQIIALVSEEGKEPRQMVISEMILEDSVMQSIVAAIAQERYPIVTESDTQEESLEEESLEDEQDEESEQEDLSVEDIEEASEESTEEK